MMQWDRQYLKMLKEAGISMIAYKRYIDDSNQLARVPPEGAVYDRSTKKVRVDIENAALHRGEAPDARLARVMKDIANEVQEGIIMEEDHPSKHSNNKMPVLDMNVWADDEGYILYTHYQ